MGELAAFRMLKMLGVEISNIPAYDLTNELIIRNSVSRL
jgi:hypothetical protein